jgi:hypothetical protein
VKAGGDLTNEDNLVTACSLCNQGKSSRILKNPEDVPAVAL